MNMKGDLTSSPRLKPGDSAAAATRAFRAGTPGPRWSRRLAPWPQRASARRRLGSRGGYAVRGSAALRR